MRYGFRALVINEYTGLTLTCAPGASATCQPDGDVLLDMLFKDTVGSIAENLFILLGLGFGLMLLAYVALWNAVRRSRQ